MKRQYSFVYALVDPKTEQIRYVGASLNPAKRLKGHISLKGASKRVGPWIGSLRASGTVPILHVIRRYPLDEIQKWEAWHIKRLRAKGCDLLNTAAKPHRHAYKGAPVEIVRTGERFVSLSDAGRAFGVCCSTIRNRIEDGRPLDFHRGPRFRYCDA